MTDTTLPRPSGEKALARLHQERRHFRRVRVAAAGRLYVSSTQEEAICTIQDISPGDASVLCHLKSEPTGRVVLYLDNFGRFEGPVVRVRPGGLIMTFSCSVQKREKMADQLMLDLNRDLLSEADLRRHDRVEAVQGSFTHYTRTTGEQVRCEVLDLSLTGVSLRTDNRPPIGEHVLVGHRAGRVARHHADGIAMEFLGLSQPAINLVEHPAAPVPPKAARGTGGPRPLASVAGARS